MLIRLTESLGINTDHVVWYESLGQLTPEPIIRLCMAGSHWKGNEDAWENVLLLTGEEREAFLRIMAHLSLQFYAPK